jgi:uncharacterized membrane protein YphA (DoxX/SURF4 family)
MLNPFPTLLIYSLLAPTILRLGAAVIVAYMVSVQWRRRQQIAAQRYPVIGSGMWIVWFAIIVECATGAGLLLGLWTQWAAILGSIMGIKGMLWERRYPAMFPLSLSASFLLLIVSLSLLLSGAGAFALDIPL